MGTLSPFHRGEAEAPGGERLSQAHLADSGRAMFYTWHPDSRALTLCPKSPCGAEQRRGQSAISTGKALANLPALRNSAKNPFPTPVQTCSEGKEADLVLILLKKCHDPLPHPLVPLVDELLAEVAVDLLGCHLLMRRERGVDKVGQL